MKIVFFGSSDFSIPSLEACLDCGAQVSLVLTTPDRRKGRGLKELPTPVKLYCRDKGVPVISPESLKVSGPLEQVRALEPDLFVAASYGKIIPAGWLKVPKARLNVHPSLLPKYRGAAPVQWALLNGDALTGVSIMDIHERLDAGDIYLQKSISLDLAVNAEELTRLLAELSRVALAETLRDFSGGRLQGRPQNEQEAVYARKLEKSDGLIDWAQPALRIHNQVRGLAPWPGAFFRDSSGECVQVLRSHVLREESSEGGGGTILGIQKDGTVWLAAGTGALAIDRVRPPGKREMTAADYVHGKRLKTGGKVGAA